MILMCTVLEFKLRLGPVFYLCILFSPHMGLISVE